MSEAFRVVVFWTAMVLVASHLGLALAAAGIPCITSLVGLRATKRLKIFTDKFGQQAATFALLGGLWVFLALLGALAIIHFLAPPSVRLQFGFPFPLAAVAGPLLAGVAVFLAYRGLWQRLKAKKAVHAALGLAASLLFWLTLYAGLASLRPLAIDEPALDWLSLLVPPAAALFWRLLAECLTLSLFFAGTLTGAWLVWRRGKDDFGRDYYNFTLRLAARIGLGAGVVSLACLAWMGMGLLPVVGELSARQSTAVALYGTGMLVALGSCGFVVSQENALRHKFLLVMALFGAIAALAGLLAGVSAVFWSAL
jgi:hypothetical protein